MSKRIISNRLGVYLALSTALISGLAIFIASFSVKIPQGPYIFTTSKNLIVALLLISILIGSRYYRVLARLRPVQWLYLVLIGIVGGSIPFLLFFKGLSLAGAASGAFIHKTLFIWVVLLAVIVLREKLTFWSILGIILLFGGNLLLLKTPGSLWGEGQRLIWLAVGFWTLENILAKKMFNNWQEIPGIVGAWGRMFFGSLIMLGYLIYIGQMDRFLTLTDTQLIWILIGSVILLGYVTTWYGALRRAPVSVVTAILVLGSPITTLLSAIFIKHQLGWKQAGAMVLFGLGVFLIIKTAKMVRMASEPQI
jgi:drug/metabolite transporter (DMT)-like permease